MSAITSNRVHFLLLAQRLTLPSTDQFMVELLVLLRNNLFDSLLADMNDRCQSSVFSNLALRRNSLIQVLDRLILTRRMMTGWIDQSIWTQRNLFTIPTKTIRDVVESGRFFDRYSMRSHRC
jgi:hypothetical protein